MISLVEGEVLNPCTISLQSIKREQIMRKKRKAFTLTELLIVVVIVGILATVALPKLGKMLETRKMVEAEQMLTAVRNEQEARCTLSKSYQGDLTKIGVYQPGKNFVYSQKVGEAKKVVGIIAKGKKYQLEIPSYTDGRICCSDGACEDLAQNYPTCKKLTQETPDYVKPNADCGVDPVVPQTPPCSPTTEHTEGEPETTTEGDCTFTRTYVWNEVLCKWNMKKEEKKCKCDESEHKDGDTEEKECDCGTKKIITWKCNSSTLMMESIEEGECKDVSQEKIACKDNPNRIWNDAADVCGCECNEGPWNGRGFQFRWQCEEGYDDQPERGAKGVWNTDTCQCDCPEGTTYDPDLHQCMCPEGLEWNGSKCVCKYEQVYEQLCEQGQGNEGPLWVPGTWNKDTCDCDCPEGTTKVGGTCFKDACRDDYAEQLCTDPPQTRIALDNFGGPVYDHEKGTWNRDTCECECPYFNGKQLPLIDGMCTRVCENKEQEREECENGSYSDRQRGIAVKGYFNPYNCQCVCPTRYGALARRDRFGRVTSCYRHNCISCPPKYGKESARDDCELRKGYTKCPQGWYIPTSANASCSGSQQLHYYPGQWDDAKCQCNCPKGTKLWNGVNDCDIRGNCIATGNTTGVDQDRYWGSEEYDIDEPYDWVFEAGGWGDDTNEDDSWHPDEWY